MAVATPPSPAQDATWAAQAMTTKSAVDLRHSHCTETLRKQSSLPNCQAAGNLLVASPTMSMVAVELYLPTPSQVQT